MKATAYYRVSSQQQAESQSIELQKARLSQFGTEEGYEIVAEFQDDGISGESIDCRPGFQECLQAISTGEVDVLLVFMIDRIGRFAMRKDRNTVVELLEDTKTNVDSPYHGLFRWDNEKELNDLEGLSNESRRDNVMRGIRVGEGHRAARLRKQFSGGRVPYGIRYDKESKRFDKDPEQFATLKLIFEKLRAGWGVIRIRDLLNQDTDLYPPPKCKRSHRRDIPSRGIRKGDPRPDLWSESTIRRFTMSDFYFTGVIEPLPASKEKETPQ